MEPAFPARRIGVVILAGGALEKRLAPVVDVKHKAWLTLGGKMLVERVLDALEPCAELACKVLVAPEEDVPERVRARVDAIAPPGRGIMDSLESGVLALPLACDLFLAVPCDMPFLEPASVQGFLRLCSARPGAVWYAYIRKEVSEARYPGLRHTWAPLADGMFCGGGLVLFETPTLTQAKAFMQRLTAARKRPLQLAGILGLATIWRFLRRRLTVADAEARASALLGACARGVETPYADVGFNVDAPEELATARALVGDSR